MVLGTFSALTLAAVASNLAARKMLRDSQYVLESYALPELKHHYGKHVHLIHDPLLQSVLARFCESETRQPTLNQLLQSMYLGLLRYALCQEFPFLTTRIRSRMVAMHPEGEFQARVLDPETRVISVNLARAGTLPSQICFDALNYIFNPAKCRQDHISANRRMDKNEQVVGTDLGGVKIGGDVEDAFVLIPDPMGATGGTVSTALDIYQTQVKGQAKRFIALHLIVTPEYLRTIKDRADHLSIYALRLDRGLSSSEILNSEPGKFWDKEKGLNHKQYIVPGAGGVGELLNNSDV